MECEEGAARRRLPGIFLPAAYRFSTRRLPWGLVAALMLGLWLAGVTAARAEDGFRHPSYIVVDASSGQVLNEFRADAIRYPASLTKLMTLYLAFEALRDRRISFETRIPMTTEAASVEPVKLGLPPGATISVHEAILAMVTLSANDVATALGQYLGGGSIPRFAEMMTLRAHALGMTNTSFENPSGLPAAGQVTTARDIAILARRLIIDFPDQYHWFSTRRFLFRGRWIVSDDNLLKAYPGADGMKTGYTYAAGHNLVTSAAHGDVRLIGVVLGTQTIPQVDGEMMALLNEGFAEESAPAAGPEIAERGPLHGLIPVAQAAPMETDSMEMAPPVPAPAAEPPDPADSWGVQVAAYASENMAVYVSGLGARILGTGRAVVERAYLYGKPVWRARIVDLSAAEAHVACPALARRKLPCWLLPPSRNGEVASR
ncbi:MAG TPA: D-alanyl-D-alanine carboxypeptidase family protein [Acetobacteraceae bacterium]|nr:D-alanyl-D-alanine carboxypeptidase family protein [Acetobacteraceae bacterium]